MESESLSPTLSLLKDLFGTRTSLVSVAESTKLKVSKPTLYII